MNLTRTRLALRHNQRLLIAAACTALALATCASAIALRMNVSSEQSPGEAPKTIHVKSDSLKLISKVNPVYPIDAKKAKIQGTVQLEALIGKDGVPMRLKVQEGPKELQQSALDAVRQWRYEPYLLNGNPIEVETTIIVIYELAK
jgi:TonB family protein